MWVVFIPLVILLFLALFAVGYFFSRDRTARSGQPHPGDFRGRE